MSRANRDRTSLVGRCLLLVLLCSSCSARERSQAIPKHTATGDSAAIALTLQQYLAASMATTSGAVPEAQLACSPEYAASRGLVLADYRVLGVTISGDSAIGMAQVASVAQDWGDSIPGHTLRVVGVRRDTLQWQLIRKSDGQWGICGYALGAIDFVQLWADSTVIWRPDGTSMKSLRALLDSSLAEQD